MSDLQIAVAFVAGQRNVSHSDLNNAINNATILTGFLTGKSALTAADPANDVLLIYDQSANSLKKITPSNLIFNSTDLITGRTLKDPPEFPDYVAIYDVAGAATKKTTLGLILDQMWARTGYASPIASDVIPIFDSNNSLSKVISLSDLISFAVSHTAPLGADSLPVYDSTGFAYKRLTINNLVNSLPAHTAPVTADKLSIYDSVGAAAKNITLGVLITGQVAETAPTDADALLFFDNSAAATRKGVLSNFKTYFQAGLVAGSTAQLAKAWVIFDGIPKTQTAAITRSGLTATFTSTAHGLSNGDRVNIAGATQPEYNGTFTIGNVTANTFDFTVTGGTTPSTGTAVVTATIKASFNIASVVRTSTGLYTITMTNALSSTHYAVAGMHNKINGTSALFLDTSAAPTTTVFKIGTVSNSAAIDSDFVSLMVFAT